MKRLNVFLMTAFLMTGIISCSDDENNDVSVQQTTTEDLELTFKATQETVTKQSISKLQYNKTNKTVFEWQSTDGFSVFADNECVNHQFRVIGLSDNNQTCVLSGKAPVSNDYYFALYPYQSGATMSYSNNVATFSSVDFPNEQTVSAGQFDSKADVMVAFSDNDLEDDENNNFHFKHVGAKLAITFQIDYVSKIKISSDKFIASDNATVTYDVSNSSVTSVSASEGQKTITVTPNDGTTFTKGETYYVSVLPVEAASLTITYYNEFGNSLSMTANPVTLNRANVYTITASPSGDFLYITIEVNGVKFNMIYVQGGTFNMGSESYATPVHQVTLSSYYIAETEVTNALYYAIMNSKPTGQSNDGDNYPVGNVSWNDCDKFITALNTATGKTFSLPTEAQWEFAARGGVKSEGYLYSGGNKIDDVAWFGRNSDNKSHEVKTKSANELGIYDMSGNVWEWCSDWYAPYSTSPATDPTGPESQLSYLKVIRGSNYGEQTDSKCNSYSRGNFNPDRCNNSIGFRLVYCPSSGN